MNNINFVMHRADGSTVESQPSINLRASIRTVVRGTVVGLSALNDQSKATLTVQTNGGMTVLGTVHAEEYGHILDTFNSPENIQGQFVLVCGTNLTPSDAQGRRGMSVIAVRPIVPAHATVH